MTLKIINGFKGSLQQFLTALTEMKKKILFFNYGWVPKTKALEKGFLKKRKTYWILLD